MEVINGERFYKVGDKLIKSGSIIIKDLNRLEEIEPILDKAKEKGLKYCSPGIYLGFGKKFSVTALNSIVRMYKYRLKNNI